ncbi:MAG: hypothetical protein NZM12_09940, partial [Steroidobacteraceae bacterium]|nr:hypothetical protein [Steroidobacteraceae bacterium]
MIAYFNYPDAKTEDKLRQALEAASRYNADGCGIARWTGERWDVTRSMSLDLDKLPRYGIVHLRAATHGLVRIDNVHPFRVKCEDGDVYLFHNGMLSYPFVESATYRRSVVVISEGRWMRRSEEPESSYSDTREFAKRLSGMDLRVDELVGAIKLTAEVTDNRFALCLPKGRV